MRWGDRELPATPGHEKEPDEPENSLKGIAVAIDPGVGDVPEERSEAHEREDRDRRKAKADHHDALPCFRTRSPLSPSFGFK